MPRWGPIVLLVLTLLAGPGALLFLALSFEPGAPRAAFETAAASEHPPLPAIEPGTPVADLLPEPPKAEPAPLYLGDDLAAVPELALEAAPAGDLTTRQWRSRKALAAAAALHLNAGEEDGFLKTLLSARSDLAGVPFLMGDACRTKGSRAAAFKEAAKARSEKGVALPGGPQPAVPEGEGREHYWQAQAAVAAQVMPAESVEGQLLRVRALASVPRPEATRALARAAVFATEGAVRASAVEALSVRREADYTAVLVEGLRYPWPAAATNAAEAIVKLGRKDLAGHLVALLEGPDPRGPRAERVAGREVTVAPEVVRVNHLRNCLLCHAPAERDKVPEETLVAEVPVPSEGLPEPREGYGNSPSNLLVRVDVTYLRQDFSAMLAVKERSAWPAVQRFDFVVRKRVLTPAEAGELRARLERRGPGAPSPYQRAAARALRGLAARELGAWGQLLRPRPS
jgi:hypothetical protein